MQNVPLSATLKIQEYKMKFRILQFGSFITMLFLVLVPTVHAQQVLNLNAANLVARSEISITPQQATYTEGSIFEVPILINTKGKSINTIDLHIKFDPTKLSIVKPSTGKSIISLWIQPPTYDNTYGTASVVGSIPGGIVSDSSLILAITFQAKSVGTTEVKISDTSSVLSNDGVGTQTILSYNRGVYTILPKPPGGLNIYSDTHPFSDHWYNNNAPLLAWNKDPGVVGFSYVLDDKPNTIPDNKNLTNEPTKSYQDLKDGLWYFHIKALKDGGAWGGTTNYLMRIDTTTPALFKPKVNYVVNENVSRALVTFFSTDALSGIDHYEIGVIDNGQSSTSSPIFTRTESPYEVPTVSTDGSTVIVRAYDFAGNSVDTHISVKAPGALRNWIKNNSTAVLLFILGIIVILYFVHYLWGHKILKRLKLITKLLRGKKGESIEEVVKEVEEIKQTE